MANDGSFVDISGIQVGNYSVLTWIKPPRQRGVLWLCRCRCGRFRVKRGPELKYGLVKACRHCCNSKYGAAVGTRLLSIWQNMLYRCRNKNSTSYERYGGRGITVCERWANSFETFRDDMGDPPGPDHSLERLNNSGPYEKSNCTWATSGEQCRNRRSNVMFTIEGRTQCLTDWASEFGVSKTAAWSRYKRGVPLEFIFSDSPVRKLITIGGITKNVTDWSKESGVPIPRILWRARKGWADDQILMPLRRRKVKAAL